MSWPGGRGRKRWTGPDQYAPSFSRQTGLFYLFVVAGFEKSVLGGISSETVSRLRLDDPGIRVTISFREYSKAGTPLAIVTIWVGVVLLS